jgi:hypothetical protein
MLALTIQCPSCGLQLRHAEGLLARIEGRCGATRCPRCRDRIYFDASSGSLQISFPDLYLNPEAEFPALVRAETSPPPHVERAGTHAAVNLESQAPGQPLGREERDSHIVMKQSAGPNPYIAGESFGYTPLPSDLIPTLNERGELVFPLLHSKRFQERG